MANRKMLKISKEGEPTRHIPYSEKNIETLTNMIQHGKNSLKIESVEVDENENEVKVLGVVLQSGDFAKKSDFQNRIDAKDKVIAELQRKLDETKATKKEKA